MAALTAEERSAIRNVMERLALSLGIPVSWVKAAVNDAAQAIEDLLDGTSLIQKSEVAAAGTGFPAIASDRIDAATSPHGVTFTAAQKKALAAKVFEMKFIRDR